MTLEKISDALLAEYLDTWQTGDVTPGPDRPHLSKERIFELAGAGGMAAAGDSEIQHLSDCPACMADWAFWVRVFSSDEKDMEEEIPTVLSGVMLRAAASPGPREALRLPSFCGQFLLGVLPEIQHPERGMITLETVADSSLIYESRPATVRDAADRVILQGRFAQGRIARVCEDLSHIDLGLWSVIIH
jgi:hypothetical protein